MARGGSAHSSAHWSGSAPRPSRSGSSDSRNHDVVARTCYAEVPPRVEYCLTAKGHALLPIIEAMRLYGSTWLAEEPC